MQDGATEELIDLCSVLGAVLTGTNYPSNRPMYPASKMKATADHRVSCTDIASSRPEISGLSHARMHDKERKKENTEQVRNSDF